MINVLIIEDEEAVAELIKYVVLEAGWTCRVASTVKQAWNEIQTEEPHLVLLDWMLPDKSGLSLLAQIRADQQLKGIPVIMLTARQMEEDKVMGLEHGADDYITKPFSPKELKARIKALIRRRSPEHAEELLKYGIISLNPVTYTVSINGDKIDMGNTEYKLLKFFLAHPNRTFSRAQLLDKVWGNQAILEERTVDVHILRLRKLLGNADSYLQTIRGIGYMLADSKQ